MAVSEFGWHYREKDFLINLGYDPLKTRCTPSFKDITEALTIAMYETYPASLKNHSKAEKHRKGKVFMGVRLLNIPKT